MLWSENGALTDINHCSVFKFLSGSNVCLPVSCNLYGLNLIQCLSSRIALRPKMMPLEENKKNLNNLWFANQLKTQILIFLWNLACLYYNTDNVHKL